MGNKELFLSHSQSFEQNVRVPSILEAPTCGAYEPNFIKVFEHASDPANIVGNTISFNGQPVATWVEDSTVFGVKRWRRGISSNLGHGPLLIKNPEKISIGESTVGVKNGLFVIYDTAFAIKVSSGGNYVTRIVLPEYQELFIEEFTSLAHIMQTMSRESTP